MMSHCHRTAPHDATPPARTHPRHDGPSTRPSPHMAQPAHGTRQRHGARGMRHEAQPSGTSTRPDPTQPSAPTPLPRQSGTRLTPRPGLARAQDGQDCRSARTPERRTAVTISINSPPAADQNTAPVVTGRPSRPPSELAELGESDDRLPITVGDRQPVAARGQDPNRSPWGCSCPICPPQRPT
ncbi:hypothetical protein FAIPA1_160076 [Frankia sp. AiPs1]